MKKEKLTKLLYFDDFCQKAEEILFYKDKIYTLISVNINNFKYINSVYGFSQGDKILQTLAKTFSYDVREFILGSRIHADRFVFLYEVQERDELLLHERLTVIKDKFLSNIKENYPSAMLHMNIGIYFLEATDGMVTSALDKAEVARKSIANNYIKEICFFSRKMEMELYLEKNTLPAFEKSLKEKRLLVYLQPKVDIDTKEIIGAEAVARMQDLNGTIIFPNAFVPVLEKKGMIIELDCFVLQEVVDLVYSWMKKGVKPVPISINLSRLDFISDEAWERILSILKSKDVPKEYIEFEITETVFFDDMEYIINRIYDIQRIGYKVSMDDFGTGYSSLNTVGILPVDIIKFDRTFVQNSIQNEKGRFILEGLLSIFTKIGLGVICEGVETKEEEQLIRKCGCRNVQGYLYGRPMPIAIFEAVCMYQQAEGEYRACE